VQAGVGFWAEAFWLFCIEVWVGETKKRGRLVSFSFLKFIVFYNPVYLLYFCCVLFFVRDSYLL
jgi:hypothetical protein